MVKTPTDASTGHQLYRVRVPWTAIGIHFPRTLLLVTMTSPQFSAPQKGAGGPSKAKPGKPAAKSRGKPRAKAQAAPRTKTRNRNNRVPDVYNPLNTSLIRSVMSEGHAFPIWGMTRSDIITNEAGRQMLFVTNTGNSGTICYSIYQTTPSATRYTIPTLSSSASAGGPTSGRAMKCGITVVNVSKRLNVGGRIYVLNASQRLAFGAAPSAMTQLQWKAVADAIIAHPHTRSYTGGDFVAPKTFVCHPTNETDYDKYVAWNGTDTLDQYFEHLAVWSGSTTTLRPMSTICIVIEPFPDDSVNDYSFTSRAAFYSRWPLASVPGQAHIPVPTAAAAVINKERDATERNAQVPRATVSTGPVFDGMS